MKCAPPARSRSGSMRVLGNLQSACGAGCLVVAVAFGMFWLTGAPDPVRMPTVPAPLAAAGATAAAAVVLTSRERRSGFRSVMVTLSAIVMLSGSLLALPHTILMVLVRAGQALTAGRGSFEVEPSWPATAVHGLNLVAAVLTALWLVTDRRLRGRRCLRCGRAQATLPAAPARPPLPVLAAVATVAALPYALLKLGWSLGWRLGLTGTAFDEVTLTSPGFGDTVLLTVLSIVVSAAMGAGAGSRALRWALAAIGACGALMLLPAGLTAAAQALPALWGAAVIDDSEIAPWAFTLVYVSFLVWGTALAWLTITYWRATRPMCPAHTVTGANHPVATT